MFQSNFFKVCVTNLQPGQGHLPVSWTISKLSSTDPLLRGWALVSHFAIITWGPCLYPPICLSLLIISIFSNLFLSWLLVTREERWPAAAASLCVFLQSPSAFLKAMGANTDPGNQQLAHLRAFTLSSCSMMLTLMLTLSHTHCMKSSCLNTRLWLLRILKAPERQVAWILYLFKSQRYTRNKIQWAWIWNHSFELKYSGTIVLKYCCNVSLNGISHHTHPHNKKKDSE